MLPDIFGNGGDDTRDGPFVLFDDSDSSGSDGGDKDDAEKDHEDDKSSDSSSHDSDGENGVDIELMGFMGLTAGTERQLRSK